MFDSSIRWTIVFAGEKFEADCKSSTYFQAPNGDVIDLGLFNYATEKEAKMWAKRLGADKIVKVRRRG